MTRNKSNPENINYFITPAIYFDIFKAKIVNIHKNSVTIELDLRHHLFIKTFLDDFTEKIKYIINDLEPNCYFQKNASEDDKFIIRLNSKIEIPYKNIIANFNIRIKNIWTFDKKTGTIFEVVSFKECEEF